MPHRQTFALVAQVAAVIVLAWWSIVLIRSSSVAAASFFSALAFGIVVSAIVEREPGRTWGYGRHPFSLAMLLAALPVGALMLIRPGPYQAPLYWPVAAQLPWVGAGFRLSGACLLVAELQRQTLNAWRHVVRVGGHLPGPVWAV